MAIIFEKINYTNRDFDSIRASCISMIQKFVPEWTNHNESDLGMVIIDLFCFVHDILNFYLDTRVNEAFLPTAVELENVINLNKLIDYNLTNYVPSSVAVMFQMLNPITNNVIIPVGQRVGTSDLNNNYVFNLIEEITLLAGTTSVVGICNEGTYFNELLGSSDGITPSKEYPLTYTNWIEDSLKIYTEDVYGNRIYYNRLGKDGGIPAFVFAEASDKVFDIKLEELKTTVIFGDGIHGYIPDNGLEIKAEYYRGNGYKANVSAQTISIIMDPITDVLGNEIPIACINAFAASGGASTETVEQAKVNGPASLRTMYRAVTDEDFQTFAKGFRDSTYGAISNAIAVGNLTYYSDAVDIYVVSEDQYRYPALVGQPLKDALKLYLEDLSTIGKEINILDPTFVPVDIVSDIHVYPSFKNSDIEASTDELMDEMFKVYNMDFSGDDGKLAHSDIVTILNSTNGVNFVYVHTPSENIPFKPSEFPVKGTLTHTYIGGA